MGNSRGEQLVGTTPVTGGKPEIQAGFYTPSRKGAIWDNWLSYEKGRYYLYYLGGYPGHWDRFELATSPDGVHWAEHGPILEPRPGTTWMGTGHIWKTPGVRTSPTWVTNYSEWFGDKQDIMFATSTDLLKWTKVDERHRFVQDTRWYLQKGRWDCIDTVERPDGGLYGYFTADPDPAKVSYPHCGFGFATSKDGVSWTALAPPEGDISGELGGVQRIGAKYYVLVSEGRVAVGDRPEGPFHTQKKNPNAFGEGCDIYFPRFFHNAPGGPLVNHFYTNGVVHAAPLKAIEVDAEGTLRLKWWKGNEKLKVRRIPVTLVPGRPPPATMLVLSSNADLARTTVIEGNVDLDGDAVARGIYFDHGDGHGDCLLFAHDQVQFGTIAADGSDFTATQTSRRDIELGRKQRFRLVVKDDMLEIYVNDYLMNLKRFRCTGTIGFLGASGGRGVTDIRMWRGE